MKIKMITPGWSTSSIWGLILFKFPVLSLPTLAAMTPPEHDVSYVDDNIEESMIIGNEDLVAISAMTPLINRAYEIADFYRARGKTVVMGGVHVTFCPDEAAEHADALVLGEAELVWPQVLKDFENGSLRKRYRADRLIEQHEFSGADRTILAGKKYFFTNLIETTRGCPFDCEFCSVTSLYGGSYRTRAVSDVTREMKTLGKPGSFVFIVDDNIIGQPKYSRSLFSHLKDLRFKWLSHASINLAFQPDLLKQAGESGCLGLFVGFETLREENLSLMGKRVNKVDAYYEAIERFHDAGIGILGSFVVGYDHDDKSTFDSIYEFTLKSRLDGGLFTFLTPFPGTRVRQRLIDENRIITNDWRLYDMEHVVYQPLNLSVDDLYQGFDDLTRSFNSVSSMFKRLFPPRRSLQFFGPSNIGFRRAWKQQLRERNRFSLDAAGSNE